METQGDWTNAARRMWLWPVAVLIGFPIGGYIADLVVDGVDSVGTAIASSRGEVPLVPRPGFSPPARFDIIGA